VRAPEQLAKLAGQLIMKLRIRANQPPLELDQLKVAASVWADELHEAGCPPRLWDEMMRLAGDARPSKTQAFAVTLDQIIHAWKHYLLGHTWSIEEEAWYETDLLITYCGECKEGYIVHEEFIEMYGERLTRPVRNQCFCIINQRTRNSYHFRRFSAAFEIRHEAPYKASRDDVVSLDQFRPGDLFCNSEWDRHVDKYVLQGETPTLKALCERLRRFSRVARV